MILANYDSRSRRKVHSLWVILVILWKFTWSVGLYICLQQCIDLDGPSLERTEPIGKITCKRLDYDYENMKWQTKRVNIVTVNWPLWHYLFRCLQFIVACIIFIFIFCFYIIDCSQRYLWTWKWRTWCIEKGRFWFPWNE